MISFCTYCSAEKKVAEKAMPAIDIYKSERITQVYTHSRTEKVEFIILSGKYGLLSPEDKIPYYDHLLKSEEVNAHARLLMTQLKEKGISKVIFWMNSVESDAHLEPYRACITMACEMASVPIEVRVAQFPD